MPRRNLDENGKQQEVWLLKNGTYFKNTRYVWWAGCSSGNSFTMSFVLLLTVLLLSTFKKIQPVLQWRRSLAPRPAMKVRCQGCGPRAAPSCWAQPRRAGDKRILPPRVRYRSGDHADPPPCLTSPGAQARGLAAAVPSAWGTLLPWQLGWICLKLRKPAGFFSTLKLVHTQSLAASPCYR